jgi:hypothetical protein
MVIGPLKYVVCTRQTCTHTHTAQWWPFARQRLNFLRVFTNGTVRQQRKGGGEEEEADGLPWAHSAPRCLTRVSNGHSGAQATGTTHSAQHTWMRERGGKGGSITQGGHAQALHVPTMTSWVWRSGANRGEGEEGEAGETEEEVE